MAEQSSKPCKTDVSEMKSTAALVPIHMESGALNLQSSHISDQNHRSSTPLQRWLSEQPGESPYNAIGSVVIGSTHWVKSTAGQTGQRAKTSSIEAMFGSWRVDGQVEKTADKKKA